MKFSEYTALAMRTCSCKTIEDRRVHGAMLIISEMGEIAAIIQKTYQGHKFDKHHMLIELGDLLWGLAEVSATLRYDNFELDAPLGASAWTQPSPQWSEGNPIHNDTQLIMSVSSLAHVVSPFADLVVYGRHTGIDDIRVGMEDIKGFVHIMRRIAMYCGASMSVVARMNIEKLRARYPDCFSADRSLNRVDGDV